MTGTAAMMIEIPDVRQIRGEGQRRWFCDEYFDLIVWYNDGNISGFQLCYDRCGHPRALTWTRGEGTGHDGIDDGDNATPSYKATPILVENGAFDGSEIAGRFAVTSSTLPPEIRSMVTEQIKEQQDRSSNVELIDPQALQRGSSSTAAAGNLTL